MANSNSLNQQVWVGAGASATMIPEMNIYLDACDGDGANPTGVTVENLGSGANAFLLVPDLYVGCMAKIRNNTDTSFSGIAMITANTTNAITFDRTIGSSADNNDIDVTILAFGAPSPAPSIEKPSGTERPALLADNWLGLVNTVSPPSVDVELGQISLALSGRDFGYQFKKNETISGGSIDMSLNNGSWLYYALGKIATVTHTSTSQVLQASSDVMTGLHANSKTKFIRAFSGMTFPPSEASTFHIANGNAGADGALAGTTELYEVGGGVITYGFGTSDGDALPSFALEITMEKDGLTSDEYYVGSEGSSTDASSAYSSNRPFKDIYSRIFTGCQVNTLTLNFEEGQEVKTNLELVSRRAFDSPQNYVPKNGVTTHTSLFNYNTTQNDDADHRTSRDSEPFLFSEGLIEVFGQTVARVKSGSLTINNNIAPQRFIGTYDRGITTAHIPGQRNYEVSLTLLVTDTDIWDNLRRQGEHDSLTTTDSHTGSASTDETLTLKFQKNANDIIQIQLDNYIIQSMDVPFPEDKGPIEMAVTLSARTLVEGNSATPTGTYYKGKWVIQNIDT